MMMNKIDLVLAVYDNLADLDVIIRYSSSSVNSSACGIFASKSELKQIKEKITDTQSLYATLLPILDDYPACDVYESYMKMNGLKVEEIRALMSEMTDDEFNLMIQGLNENKMIVDGRLQVSKEGVDKMYNR